MDCSFVINVCVLCLVKAPDHLSSSNAKESIKEKGTQSQQSSVFTVFQ